VTLNVVRVGLSRVGEENDAMPNYQNSYHACCNKSLKMLPQTSGALFISQTYKSVLHYQNLCLIAV